MSSVDVIDHEEVVDVDDDEDDDEEDYKHGDEEDDYVDDDEEAVGGGKKRRARAQPPFGRKRRLGRVAPPAPDSDGWFSVEKPAAGGGESPGGHYQAQPRTTRTQSRRRRGGTHGRSRLSWSGAGDDEELEDDFVVDDDAEIEYEDDEEDDGDGDSGDDGGESVLEPVMMNLDDALNQFRAPSSEPYSRTAERVTAVNLALSASSAPSPAAAASRWRAGGPATGRIGAASLGQRPAASSSSAASIVSAKLKQKTGLMLKTVSVGGNAASNSNNHHVVHVVDDSPSPAPDKRRNLSSSRRLLKKKYISTDGGDGDGVGGDGGGAGGDGARKPRDFDEQAELTLAVPDSDEDDDAYRKRLNELGLLATEAASAAADSKRIRRENDFTSSRPATLQSDDEQGDVVKKKKEEPKEESDVDRVNKLVAQCEQYSAELTRAAKLARLVPSGGGPPPPPPPADEAAAESASVAGEQKKTTAAAATAPVPGIAASTTTSQSATQSATQSSNAASQPRPPSPSPLAEAVIGQPAGVPIPLRDYQLAGLNWMNLLRLQNKNGIMGDEMGLGKTAQTIAYLAYLSEQGVDPGRPHLVVCPASILENWAREIERFAPNLLPFIYHGPKAEREELQRDVLHRGHDYDIMVTSYNMVFAKEDRKFLQRLNFSYMVLDEAHALKNPNALRYQYLTMVARSCKHRLLLTGTPLQNDLKELWALIGFLMPNQFGAINQVDVKALLKNARSAAERDNLERDWTDRAKKILQPFLLRRLKSDVTSELAEKQEHVVRCTMTPEQRVQYQEAVRQSARWVDDDDDDDGDDGDDENDDDDGKDGSHGPKPAVSSSSAGGGDGAAAADGVGGGGAGATEDDPISLVDLDPDNDGDDDVITIGSKAATSTSTSATNNGISSPPGHNDYVTMVTSPIRRVKRADSVGEGGGGVPVVGSKPALTVKKTTNVIMLLRKVANHPMLCRRLYDEEKIAEISRILLATEAEFAGYPYQHMVEDLRINSDFEIHRLCLTSPALAQYALTAAQIAQAGGKFGELRRLLEQFRAEGVKTLVFSQMTRMLDIAEVFMHYHGYQFVRLDGQTPVTERQTLIDRFQRDDNVRVFLLSTRAGGLGINLTAACRVVFYDMSFNPYDDKQAVDRAHRMGQTRQVQVYRLAMAGSIDESILELQADKSRFNDRILAEGEFTTEKAHVKENNKILMSLVRQHLKAAAK